MFCNQQPPLEQKLDILSQQHDTLLSQLHDNSLNPTELTEAFKEVAQMSATKYLFDYWLESITDLTAQHELLSSGDSDEYTVEFAREEYTEIMELIQQLEKDLLVKELAASKHTSDNASASVETTSSAGGDDASIFTTDMVRIYERFIQLQRGK